ncbi:type II CRISPR RNA-guided endonuclease Cas9 [Formosa sp. A9]|uniref:type II CRISPR RNA-guided endonuclease Cas9 n=1 Tax=Formosa sp. A9 TaxID=3442641 RepID=UPI003EBFAA9C
MNKTLGIDLGTNSIGLTLREDNIFSWYGVYTFKKGVGEGKSGEFSFAAERTKHRSSRRLYNSRRYRKWETLKVLIENGYCPLKIENLNKWKNYKKGIGRVFPINDKAFQQWIRLDLNGDGVADFSSPYQLRRMLITEKLDLTVEENRYKVGRALYHIAQRRGFKSSRKQGANEKTAVFKGSNETKTVGRNDYENLIVQCGSLGAAFAHLEDKHVRVRNRYTLRADYLSEVHKILEFQNIIENDFKEMVEKAIFFQRPLRSQKGLVGKCTLESNKSRCPISHPKFEEYRAWSFINNIKYRIDAAANFEPIPLDLKEKIYHEKFFFKSKREFDFNEIRKFIIANGGKNWELNYSKKMDKVSVSSCFVSARLKSVFGEDWENFEKSVVKRNRKGEDGTKTYTIQDVWHVLFSFEDEEYFEEFLIDVLVLNENQVKELKGLFNNFPVGYANLSLKAINNILPFLREGMIYSEAVILAKIPEILGIEVFEADKEIIFKAIRDEIKENRYQKKIVNITNNLIFKYYGLDYQDRFGWKDVSYKLVESDLKDIEIAAIENFGDKTWLKLDDDYKQQILNVVAEKYQDFFASSKREHIKPPHLLNQIKQFLDDNFNVGEKLLDKIYHPSQIAIYPNKEGQEFLLSPKTAAFKNPMAYKTLYKLRDVVNYLLEIGKIDAETRIVVEIAREGKNSLDYSNKRWAIETYQRNREVENRMFASAIEELIKDPDFKGVANPQSAKDTDKFRLWSEQLENYDEVVKSLNASKNDVQKYRLWKEQNCICMYTGKLIKLTDLFDTNKIDFEHTIPRSKSFDNSLANLTVCYADYNRGVKNNRMPTELPNYKSESHGYTAIEPRLHSWEKKVDDLYNQIEFWKSKSKRAMDKGEKDNAIRQRHLRQMEHDYWKNKLDRFTRTEVPKGFINSQLIDTQIITKYATHYLQTVFNKVDVIKGTNTAEFRKIYEIQPKGEAKDRGKHYHHAIDAAVLTLIPSARKREEILKKAYEFGEANRGSQYHEKPFSEFNYSMIEEIKKNILINNMADKDQTLTPGIKKVRKRGRIVWLRDGDGKLLLDSNGDKIPKIAQGDSVRGELHQQTYYGKIKIAAKDEKGSLQKDEEGNIVYNQVDGKDEMWMVLRKPIDTINFKTDVIVDDHLAKYLRKQLAEGVKQNELKDFQGNVLRHLRCRVKAARGFMNPDNATIVKEQIYKSSKDYKNYIYADSGENYMFGLYENENGRSIIPFNVFESAQYSKYLDKVSFELLFKSKEPVYIGRGKNLKEAELKHVFMVGQKVLMYINDKEELKDLDVGSLSERLYMVKRLTDAKTQRIMFQHHMEARDEKQLVEDFPKDVFGTKGKDGFSSFSSDFVAPRLLLTPGKYDFAIEEKDFEMKLDGSITWKF